MSKPKHSPAPWVNKNAVIRSGLGTGLDDVVAICRDSDFHNAEANAALIAAAPQLLRELKSAVLFIETFGGDVTSSFSAGGNMDAVKKIISQAEGGSL